jgi:hypothetical protein
VIVHLAGDGSVLAELLTDKGRIAFVMSGLMKATQAKAKLEPRLPWVEDFSAGTIRFIGIAELLGGLGSSCLRPPASLRSSPRSPRRV